MKFLFYSILVLPHPILIPLHCISPSILCQWKKVLVAHHGEADEGDSRARFIFKENTASGENTSIPEGGVGHPKGGHARRTEKRKHNVGLAQQERQLFVPPQFRAKCHNHYNENSKRRGGWGYTRQASQFSTTKEKQASRLFDNRRGDEKSEKKEENKKIRGGL